MKKINLIWILIIMLVPFLYGQTTDEAINFTAVDIAGNSVELFSYKDKLILLDFWATWCGPCRREIPNIIDIKETFKNSPFEIISIALENGKIDYAKKFVKEQKMNWVHIIDLIKGQQIAEKYNVMYIPAVFLIRNGKILSSGLRGEELKEKIKQLLAKKDS
ncbi:MAG: TlpA family protein disulfide reductase [Acidobacteria bacterium]|jgi:thiol-disulfide isomerase/thioredoxin|nr:TlpA family protein disulfide reductase [Acidobacteriota bacterium]